MWEELLHFAKQRLFPHFFSNKNNRIHVNFQIFQELREKHQSTSKPAIRPNHLFEIDITKRKYIPQAALQRI